MFRRKADTNPFRVSPEAPVGELPPGFHLKRVGPGEWIAEPSRSWLRPIIYAGLAFCVGGVAGALAARSYYHRSATPMIVTVNGSPLRQDELRFRCERLYGLGVVKRFVADELTRQFAESKDCWPDEDEVAKFHERERRKPDYLDRLALSGLTDDAFRDQLRLELSEVKLLTRNVTVTPSEVRAFYHRNIDPTNPGARFHTPDRVQVSAIGTLSAESARQALSELAGGVPWNTVVARYSVDASRDVQGRMLPFARGESVFATEPATEAAVFAMSPGERIGPVRAARKWWLIRCNARWRASTQPFDEAEDDARLGAMLLKGIPLNRRKMEEEREAFVRRSSIRIFTEAYGEAAEPDLSRPIRW
jgi:hypothetical protein